MNKETEKRKEEIKKQADNLFEVFKEVAQLNLAVCPEWKVTGVRITNESAEVSICLQECNDFYMKIIYNKECAPVEKESFETRVMGHGAFQLLQDNYIADYYCAVADIIQHKKMLELLKDYMTSCVQIHKTFYTEYINL